MRLGVLRMIVLFLLWLGATPTLPQSGRWGYGRSGGWGPVLIVGSVLLLAGRL